MSYEVRVYNSSKPDFYFCCQHSGFDPSSLARQQLHISKFFSLQLLTLRTMQTIRAVERHFSHGLVLAPSVPRAEPLPGSYTDVAPTELPAVSELDQLFRLKDLNQVMLDSLRPVVGNGDLLKPACFLAALHALPNNLRDTSELLPDAAPSFGRAALLVSNLIRLVNQGLSYQAAIVEA